MKILSVSASNFASYKKLDFTFDNQGLCLVAGPTGSGKSTLCDLVPWALFGRSAKDGAADDVISWNAEEPTSASVRIGLPHNRQLLIRRGRQPNDLYYNIAAFPDEVNEVKRGKDLNDTQKQINQLLGMTYETYMAGSYFHEFSKTASFFTTTAKNRRDICEQIVDLSMAKNLQAKASDELRTYKQKVDDITSDIKHLQKQMFTTKDSLQSSEQAAAEFDDVKARRIEAIKQSDANFETQKQQRLINTNATLVTSEASLDKMTKELHQLNSELKDDKCDKCGAHLDIKVRMQRLKLSEGAVRLRSEIKTHKQDFERTINSVNPYATQLVSEETRENSYIGMARDLKLNVVMLDTQLNSALAKLDNYRNITADLELLQDTLQTFRATLIADTMGFIQDKTNNLLSDYFDGELKVIFDVKQADKLDVLIYKDGNECNFTQLSKGQRQLLKLTFGISVMQAVANHSGVKFNCLMFDEAMDGLSDTLKQKAYCLFEKLAIDYSSVFFVDHSESLKAIANKSFLVTNENGESKIEET